MTDTLRFTVHGATHRDLCDAVDDEVARFLGYDPPNEYVSPWRVISSEMRAIPHHQFTANGEVIIPGYTADVVVHLEVRDRPDESVRSAQMRITLFADDGTPLLTTPFTTGEYLELPVPPGLRAYRVTVTPV